MSKHRPRKTAKQWERLIAQQACSGVSIAEFCNQQDVALSTFSKWNRRFKMNASSANNAFKQVKVPQPSPAPIPTTPGSVVSVQIGHDIVLTIRSGGPLP